MKYSAPLKRFGRTYFIAIPLVGYVRLFEVLVTIILISIHPNYRNLI